MTFTDYWNALKQRNAGLADDGNKMTITVESFRKSMRQAFEMGEKNTPKADGKPFDFGEMFKGL